jgi:hypothetical protein
MDMWAYYAEVLWPLICTPSADKLAKSTAVQFAGLKYAELFASACGAKTILYIHLLTAHLPQQIRNFPVDPAMFQTSGLEHGHKLRKLWARTMSNCLLPHVIGTTKTVDAYFNRDGHLVASYVQSIGHGRLHQLLRLEVVANTLFKANENPDGQLHIMEKDKRQAYATKRAAIGRLNQAVAITVGPTVMADVAPFPRATPRGCD